MKINIAQAILNEGELFSDQYEGAFAGIEFLGDMFEFPQGARVSYDWRFDGDGVIVTGHFDASMKVRCARCTEAFLHPLGFEFAEYYKKQPEEGMYAYEGELIDLTQMIEDNIVINLPTRFLCKQDCLGLCSSCGQNLNEGACDCRHTGPQDSPFSELAKLYDDEEV